MKTFSTRNLLSTTLRYCHILVIVLLIWSCKKDNEPIFPYPSIYHATRSEITSDVRLFTKQGEIKDQMVITDFMKRYNTAWTTIIAPKSETVTYQDTVKILTKDNVQGPFYLKDAYLQFNENIIYIISRDTGYSDLNEFYESNVVFGKYKPIYEKKVYYSPSTGVNPRVFTIPINYAEYTSEQLKFLTLSYMVKRGTGAYYSTYGSRYNNSFDPTSYKALLADDTLVVQESNIVYEK
ncbi:hypothetical protein [Xanthocytophaga flava]|uniref:hypothetical protein n=1 Tax=Xanthocytophaga flava TaxID=3048013 RepID=UPI0028CFDF97|nr:hypothetical protein [Xanthocytophaga flavus]MDJ1469024.1 hypothetical protein [Xanthocytophaga flavus]